MRSAGSQKARRPVAVDVDRSRSESCDLSRDDRRRPAPTRMGLTMTDLATDSVISGVPYAVTRSDGSPAAGVADFVGDTDFLVHQAQQHSLVSGTGVLDDSGTAVRFYQKDPLHDGRDVRIWCVQDSDDTGVTARHDAAI
jgi:hypothetical protein